MNIPVRQNDLILAQETCEELSSGNKEAILGIYNKYQPLFMGYTRRRMQRFDSDKATLNPADPEASTSWKRATSPKA